MISNNHIIIKFQFLLPILLALLCVNVLFANDDLFLNNITIVDEDNLSQVKNHEPVFQWSTNAEVENLELFIITENQDSLIWSLEPENFTENQFKLVTPHLLVDGYYYKFQITIQDRKKSYIYFVMNSHPKVVQIQNEQNQVFDSDSLIIKISKTSDKEISADSLKYQLKIIDQQNITESVVDTIICAIDSNTIFIDGKQLKENGEFTLHIKSFDGVEFSDWSNGFRFYMNRISEPPIVFRLKYGKRPQVFKKEPKLKWEKSEDPEQLFGGEIINYNIEISPYEDFMMLTEQKIVKGKSFSPEKSENHRKYFWRVTAMDSDSLKTTSENVGAFFINHNNEKPPKAKIISPINSKIINPQDLITWQQPKDKDRWDNLFYTINLFEKDKKLSSFNLSESKIDSVKKGFISDISISYDNRVQLPLEYLVKSKTLIEGNEYQILIETFDTWQGKNKTQKTTFIFDDNINQTPFSPMKNFRPDSIIIRTALPMLAWEKANDPDIYDQLKYEVMISLDPGFFTARSIQQETGYCENSIQIHTELMENKQYRKFEGALRFVKGLNINSMELILLGEFYQ